MTSLVDKESVSESIDLVIGGAMGAIAYEGIQRVMGASTGIIESVLLGIGGVAWILALVSLTAVIVKAYSAQIDEEYD